MSKIIFLSDPSIIFEGKLSKVNENVIRLEFKENVPDEKLLLSDLNIINEHNGEIMAERIGYDTIYRIYEDKPLMIELSNNKTVWVKPLSKINFSANGGAFENDAALAQEVYNYEELIIPTPIANENYKFVRWNPEIPENGEVDGNKTFTAMFEYIPTLDEVKAEKINIFSNICKESIVNGVDVQIDKNTIEHFSYTDEDQTNIKEIFDLALQTNVPMHYHANGNDCKLYSVDQIIAIYSSASTNKMHHQTYFNQIRSYINSLNNVDEINEVEYGQELTGKYLDTYNDAMNQAKIVLETLLSNRVAILAGTE